MCCRFARHWAVGAAALIAAVGVNPSAEAHLFTFVDASGLSAEAEFTLLNPTTVMIRVRNTSTGVPAGFSNADQLLTGISWDFGATGSNPGEPQLTGGTALIGPTSQSVNFSTGSYGPGTDVGGEWGFGSHVVGGALLDFISTLSAHATAFGGPNLDGPVGLAGPQGGLVANPAVLSLGGTAAIQDEIIVTINLNAPLANLDAMFQNGVRAGFGARAMYLDGVLVPGPGSIALCALALLLVRPRRRRWPVVA